jgi:hypothetical protein
MKECNSGIRVARSAPELSKSFVPMACAAAAAAGFLGTLLRAALMIISTTFAGAAAANCVCQCVNGELAAICVGNVAVQPACAPRSCPAPTANLSMARNLQASTQGGGGSDCAPRQVLNPISGQYEWKVLCR